MNTPVSDEGRAPTVPRRNEGRKSQKTGMRAQRGSATWLVAGLLVLSVIPLISGALRLTQLAGGAEIMPARARFDASPLPVVLHIVSAAVYSILGAFQFAPGFRRRRPGWHRAAGRLLVACGLLVGLSALWMTQFYPGANGASALLYADAARVWVGHGRLHHLRLYHDPARRRAGAPRVDDARVRDRAWGGHAGADPASSRSASALQPLQRSCDRRSCPADGSTDLYEAVAAVRSDHPKPDWIHRYLHR